MIKKMTASFGALSRQTLMLHEGLNVISLPNEAGKSTWAEFILAMFYGVETREQQRIGGPMPIKKRCLPWNGAPMEGSLTLDDVTLERTGSSRAPMSVFKAYRTDSGVTVPELTGANCGQTLLGVERAVFERSAFIRQSGLSVTKDAALEQRLGALVTTGDDGCSYTVAAGKLHSLHNTCSFGKTGLLYKTEAALAEVQQRLDAITALQERMADTEAAYSQHLQEQARLQEAAAALEAIDVSHKREQLRQAQALCSRTMLTAQKLESLCSALPSRDELERLNQALQTQSAQLQTAQLEAALASRELPKPTTPAVFAGMTPREAQARAQADADTLTQAQTPPKRRFALLLLGILLLAAGLLGGSYCFFHLPAGYWLGGAICALAGAACLIVSVLLHASVRKKAAAQDHAAQLLLAKYGARSATEMTALAADYATQITAYEQNKAAADDERARCATALNAQLLQQAQLLAQIRSFAPKCENAEDARTALSAAQRAYEEADAAKREQAQADARLADLQQAIGTLRELPEADYARYEACDPEQLHAAQAECSAQLLAARSQLDQYRGRLAALGEPLALAAQKEQLSQHLAELNRKNEALTLAENALAEANRALQSRFSPMLCKTAGELFSRLTDGRYEKLLLSSSFEASAQLTGDTVLRPSLALSCGTVDQLYLAVRLAIAQLLLPPDAPLILDDALMAFDDERAQRAMQVLREQAASRQILLFTCHERELHM